MTSETRNEWVTSAAPTAAVRPRDHGHDRDRGQTGGAGDGVVHTRGHAHVIGIDRAHDRRGQRRDERDEPEAEHHRPGQHVG